MEYLIITTWNHDIKLYLRSMSYYVRIQRTHYIEDIKIGVNYLFILIK